MTDGILNLSVLSGLERIWIFSDYLSFNLAKLLRF